MQAIWIVVYPVLGLAFCWGFLRTAVEIHEYHVWRKHALLRKRAIRAIRGGM